MAPAKGPANVRDGPAGSSARRARAPVYTPPPDALRRARSEHRRAAKAGKVYTEPDPDRPRRDPLARRQAPEPAPEAAEPAQIAAEPAAGPEPAPPPEPARGTGGGARPGQALGGLIVGLFAWGYGLNWIRGGQAQANGWFGAKFLNEPYAGTAGAGTGAAAGSGGGGNNKLMSP